MFRFTMVESRWYVECFSIGISFEDRIVVFCCKRQCSVSIFMSPVSPIFHIVLTVRYFDFLAIRLLTILKKRFDRTNSILFPGSDLSAV